MGEVKDQHYLKGLQTRREKLKGEIECASQDKTEALRRYDELTKKLKELEKQIRQFQERDTEVSVSEHAYLRYFEHVLGFDLNEIKKQILPEVVESQIKLLGSGKFPVQGSHKLVVKNRHIVTLIIDDHSESRPKKT